MYVRLASDKTPNIVRSRPVKTPNILSRKTFNILLASDSETRQ